MSHNEDNQELRIRKIEDRLQRLEQLLGISTVPDMYEKKGQHEKNIQPQPENLSHSDRTPKSRSQFSMNLLAILGVICFLTAAGFIIQVSIESRIFTPDLQIILSAALGVILIGAGLFMRRYDSKYSTYLPATGITVLFLTTLAAHLYHPVLSFLETLLGITIASGLSIALYYKLKEEIFALVAIIGTYTSPIVLNIFAPTEAIFLYYFVFTVTFTGMGVLYKSRAIWIVLTYLSVISTAMIGINFKTIDVFLMSALALQFGLCVLGIMLYVKKHNISLSSVNVWLYLPIILIFAGVEMYWISIIKSNLLPWTGIAFAFISVALLLIVKRTLKDSENLQSLLCVTTIFGIVSSSLQGLFPSSLTVWTLPIMILGYILAKKFLPPRTTSLHTPFRVPILILLVIFVLNYLLFLFNLTTWRFAIVTINFNTLSAMLTSSALLWTIILFRHSLSSRLVNQEALLLVFTHILTIKALYHSVEQFGSLAVSSVWLAYSIAVLILAFGKRDRSIAQSSILILMFAAAKALLYDASHAPTTIRIICLLITGVVLFSAGYLMRRIATWKVEA